MDSLQTQTILGIPFSRFSWQTFLPYLDKWIESKKKAQVAVVNAHSIVSAYKDDTFLKAIQNSHFVIADGISVVYLSRLMGKPLPERLAGPDLLNYLCQLSGEKGYRMFFLGSTPQVLEGIEKNVQKKFPKAVIAGTYSPPMRTQFSEDETNEMINKINQASPHILWVGMTAPKQEKWIAQNLEKLDCCLALGIGAAFEFIAGTKERAPLWVRKMGMEWLHRFIQEPGRLWRRYTVSNAIFSYMAIKEIFKYRLGVGK